MHRLLVMNEGISRMGIIMPCIMPSRERDSAAVRPDT